MGLNILENKYKEKKWNDMSRIWMKISLFLSHKYEEGVTMGINEMFLDKYNNESRYWCNTYRIQNLESHFCKTIDSQFCFSTRFTYSMYFLQVLLYLFNYI